MAISVNKIYQTVLALANKEQRGYITPQEFNLFADQAQIDIFEQYFYDLNQFKRVAGNDTYYSDMVNVLEEKISLFEKTSGNQGPSATNTKNVGTQDEFYESSYSMPIDFYRLVGIKRVHPIRGPISEIEKLNIMDYERAIQSPLTRGAVNRPICSFRGDIIHVAPVEGGGSMPNIKIEYIRKPFPPSWTYIVVNEKPLYNSSAADHQDFELHDSEQKNLVIKILQLAGISIKDYNVTQAAAQEEVKTIQQQKS